MTIRAQLRLISCLTLCSGLSACDKADDSGKAKDEASASQPATSTTKDAKDKEADPGEASMKIAGFDWKADEARFRQEQSKLTIRANATQVTDGNVARQELHLRIDDFKGPGSYTTAVSGSRFVSVGVDTAAAQNAAKEGEDAKIEVIGDALAKAGHLMLSNAKITIERASETEIVGSFAWKSEYQPNDPELSEGRFRAVVERKR